MKGEDLKLVLVHLGPKSAPHLWKNLEYLREQFEEFDMTLIVDHRKNIARAKRRKINYWIYKPSSQTEIAFQHSAHNLNFRHGFWRYSLERFMALSDFHQTQPSTQILHIESDILILPNVDPFVFKSQQLMWMKFNDTHDVGAVMFSPSGAESKWLTDSMIELLLQDNGLTDMTILKKVRDSHPGRTNTYPCFLEDAGEVIFDAAPIGMWLTGEDPRNHKGWLVLHRELPESVLRPEKLDFELDSQGLWVTHNKSMRKQVVTLHVHSKEVKLFGRNSVKALAHYVELSLNKNLVRRFVFKKYFAVIFDYATRNNLLLISTWRKIAARSIGNHGNLPKQN
jgi:hypothetical protein